VRLPEIFIPEEVHNAETGSVMSWERVFINGTSSAHILATQKDNYFKQLGYPETKQRAESLHMGNGAFRLTYKQEKEDEWDRDVTRLWNRLIEENSQLLTSPTQDRGRCRRPWDEAEARV
jgi:hypothetical protein